MEIVDGKERILKDTCGSILDVHVDHYRVYVAYKLCFKGFLCDLDIYGVSFWAFQALEFMGQMCRMFLSREL